MAYQTQIKDGRLDSVPSAPRRVARNLTGLAHDVLELAELQGQLFVLDVKQGLRGMILPAIVLVCGVVLAVSGLPVLLVALARGLEEGFGMPLWGALLIAAATGMVVGGIFALIAMKWLTSKLNILQRSQTELRRNLMWLKYTLKDKQREEHGHPVRVHR